MSKPQPFVLFNGNIVPAAQATVSVASSAVLYGLSVYSVFLATKQGDNWLGFRVPEHITRLKQSAHMIGFKNVESVLHETELPAQLHALIEANQPSTDQFFRITIHATELIPGVRTSNLELTLSVFMHDAINILPRENVRLKTSLWRRTTDTSIPARAKVNGAYVNSALAKQDALDAGCDDCLFLNQQGYVSELSAANVFMIKRGELITPDCSSDILEGITRRSVIELAHQQHIPVTERKVALTEFYTADEVFACGTSACLASVNEIDNRKIASGSYGPLTAQLEKALKAEQWNPDSDWTILL